MKITEITIEYGRTTRPADFESKSCRLTVKAVLEDGEDAKKVTDDLLDRVQERVEARLK